jgi:hypothetical protein
MFLLAKIMQKNDSPKRISCKLAPDGGFVSLYREAVWLLLPVALPGCRAASAHVLASRCGRAEKALHSFRKVKAIVQGA